MLFQLLLILVIILNTFLVETSCKKESYEEFFHQLPDQHKSLFGWQEPELWRPKRVMDRNFQDKKSDRIYFKMKSDRTKHVYRNRDRPLLEWKKKTYKDVEKKKTSSVVVYAASNDNGIIGSTFPTNAQTTVTSTTPTKKPSLVPIAAPSLNPIASPSLAPVATPTKVPSSKAPTSTPTRVPLTKAPNGNPTVTPSTQELLSAIPTIVQSTNPSVSPSAIPTIVRSTNPSVSPSAIPTVVQSTNPSVSPSAIPTVVQSTKPSVSPSAIPTTVQSTDPSVSPSFSVSTAPSTRPSAECVGFALVIQAVSITANQFQANGSINCLTVSSIVNSIGIIIFVNNLYFYGY